MLEFIIKNSLINKVKKIISIIKTKIHFDKPAKWRTISYSTQKLITGGTPKFAKSSSFHTMANLGLKVSRPLLKNFKRELEILYSTPTL